MQNTLCDLQSLQTTTLDAGLVFSGKKSGNTVQGYSTSSSYTPTVNNKYIFHENSRDIIVWLMNPADPLYVFGPTGCGKTSCIKQLAGRLNYPVFEITGHGRLEFADLAGHLTVKNGNMTYEYGPLSLAMRYGGLLLFNEIDLTAPEVAAGLNSILDGAPLCLTEHGGELIYPHPMFRFVATANTNGSGDETGLYQGTQRQNLAWLDRFILCEMGYPKEEVEKNLLTASFPALPQEVIDKLVEYAHEVRKLFMGESLYDNMSNTIEVTFSTRTLLRWAELTLRFQPLAHQGIQPVTYALDRALGYRASRETRALLHELAQRIFPQENITSQKQQGNTQFLTLNASNWENKVGEFASADLTKCGHLPSLQLENSSSSGGKFWKATLRSDGLQLTWGKLHTTGQSRHIPREQCLHNDPALEFIARAKKKIQGGYHIINQ